MKVLRLTLIWFGLWGPCLTLAEPGPSPVHIVVDSSPVDNGSFSIPVSISAAEPLMGGGVPKHLKIHLTPTQAKLEPVIYATLIDRTLSPNLFKASKDQVLILVGANLQSGKSLADQLAFKALEHPLIKKHKGEILLSLKTPTNEKWPFDIFEIIAFPSLDHYEALMKDPAYSPDQPLGKTSMETYTEDLRVSIGQIL